MLTWRRFHSIVIGCIFSLVNIRKTPTRDILLLKYRGYFYLGGFHFYITRRWKRPLCFIFISINCKTSGWKRITTPGSSILYPLKLFIVIAYHTISGKHVQFSIYLVPFPGNIYAYAKCRKKSHTLCRVYQKNKKNRYHNYRSFSN